MVLSEEPLLETERLILRPPRAEDLPGWAAMMADPGNSRFIGGPLGPCRLGKPLDHGGGVGASRLRQISPSSSNPRPMDRPRRPWMPPGWPGPEIGWAFLKEHWGQGYAAEAARATMEWSRDVLGWDHAIHIIHRRIRLHGAGGTDRLDVRTGASPANARQCPASPDLQSKNSDLRTSKFCYKAFAQDQSCGLALRRRSHASDRSRYRRESGRQPRNGGSRVLNNRPVCAPRRGRWSRRRLSASAMCVMSPRPIWRASGSTVSNF